MNTKPRRILLAGATGQVGWELCRALEPLGEILAPRRDQFDLLRPESLRAKIQDWKPDLIVNSAAYTAVDRAESEPRLAFRINAESPRVMAEEAATLGIPMVHYSTDYVFDGAKTIPYTEEDDPNPLNVYGESKLKGEQNIQSSLGHHLILRSSWIYSLRGQNFLITLLRLLKEEDEIRVIDDQIGAPTWARVLAEATQTILNRIYEKTSPHLNEKRWGLYHLTAAGNTSWYGYAMHLRGLSTLSTAKARLQPIPSTEYICPASRPLNSRLSNSKFNKTWSFSLPHWDFSLKQSLSAR